MSADELTVLYDDSVGDDIPLEMHDHKPDSRSDSVKHQQLQVK